MTVYISSVALAFTILGLILWLATEKAPVKEIGRLLFLAGLIGLAVLSKHAWQIG